MKAGKLGKCLKKSFSKKSQSLRLSVDNMKEWQEASIEISLRHFLE